MFRININAIKSYLGTAALAVPAMAFLCACGTVFEDLAPCPQGVVLRFRYDYNLEFANAFHNQVECLTVHIYDADSNYVATHTETSARLASEDYCMTLDLPAGKYHAVAYGGIACEETSFAHPSLPQLGTSLSALELKMNPDHTARHLHDQFHGSTAFTVRADALDYTYDTVSMQKNTNHFRILLQNLNYQPLDGNDFEFSILADNTHFNHDNSLRSAGATEYTAWSRGQYDAGIVSAVSAGSRAEVSSSDTVKVAYGELSTSRMMKPATSQEYSPTLVIRHTPTDKEVARLPLVNYLLMSKSFEEEYNRTPLKGRKMTDQEYLDRQSRWNMMFFVDDNNTWVQTRIVVNDWVVRINNTDF